MNEDSEIQGSGHSVESHREALPLAAMPRTLWQAFKDGFDPVGKLERELMERMDRMIAEQERRRTPAGPAA